MKMAVVGTASFTRHSIETRMAQIDKDTIEAALSAGQAAQRVKMRR